MGIIGGVLGLLVMIILCFIRKKIWLARLESVFPEIFADLNSVNCSMTGVEKVVFRHCGMDGCLEFFSSRNSAYTRLGLNPNAGTVDFRSDGGLSIDVHIPTSKFIFYSSKSELQSIYDMDEEYFRQYCKVNLGQKSFPGTALPESVRQLLRKVVGTSFAEFSVYCGPDQFKVNTSQAYMFRDKDKTKEFVAASLLLLKELVHMRPRGLPMDELNLPAAYGDVDFSNDEFLPQSVREHLNNAMAASEDASKDPLLKYWSHASGMGMTDEGIYDQVDEDSGRVRVKRRRRAAQDDAHALHDGKSRWME